MSERETALFTVAAIPTSGTITAVQNRHVRIHGKSDGRRCGYRVAAPCAVRRGAIPRGCTQLGIAAGVVGVATVAVHTGTRRVPDLCEV